MFLLPKLGHNLDSRGARSARARVVHNQPQPVTIPVTLSAIWPSAFSNIVSAGAQMSKSKHGKIDGQFVPLLTPHWIAQLGELRLMVQQSLYVALKRRCLQERNLAFVSYRDACKAHLATERTKFVSGSPS